MWAQSHTYESTVGRVSLVCVAGSALCVRRVSAVSGARLLWVEAADASTKDGLPSSVCEV